MSTVTSLMASREIDADEWQLRVDLAAVFRIAAELNWHEAIANHFSAAVSPDGRKFLINPRWKHFSLIKASDLLLLDSEDPSTMEGPDAPDPTAWWIHGSMHRALPQARCILHVHPTFATALSTLADPTVKPIDQNTARYFNRIAVDLAYGGMADENDEGERLVRALGNARLLMMGNHGVMVTGETIAEAFDDLYYLERACQTLILAYSTGQELNVLSDDVAERTAQSWEAYKPSAFAHFSQMKEVIARKDRSYAE